MNDRNCWMKWRKSGWSERNEQHHWGVQVAVISLKKNVKVTHQMKVKSAL
jgi:hypothetical protein